MLPRENFPKKKVDAINQTSNRLMNHMKNQNSLDLIIIGAGSAGLSAAIYAARKKLNTIILTKKIGGQSLLANKIENYPGIKSISGVDLISLMREQIKDYGIKIMTGLEIKQIKQSGNKFAARTSKNLYQAKTVLITSGKMPRRLNVPGEKELEGKGISFCSICDAPLYKGRDVAVIGSSDAGLEAALDLIKYANKIYVLGLTTRLLGDKSTQEKLRASNKVTFILNAVTKEIKGKKFVEQLVYEDRKTGENYSLKVSGVFAAIGSVPSTDFVENLLRLNDKKEIIIDLEANATNIPGIFAAGDVTNIPFKQCVIAAGEGAKAALNVYSYLQK